MVTKKRVSKINKMDNLNKAMRDIVTGRDNQTHDFMRWLGILTAFAAITLEVYTVVIKNAPFDVQSFGVGMGAVFTTVGIALKLKETTEPGNHMESSVQVTQVCDNKIVEATATKKD